MRQARFWRLCLGMFLMAVCFLPAQDAAAKATPHREKPQSVARYADIVIEADTGRILHATSAEQQRHPASLTKMMTLYLTFQALEAGRLALDQRLAVSANAAAQSPSKLGLRTGQTIRVQDAILALVTESANDAAMVLGEALGGSGERFGALMTRQARALGMKSTTFKNPSGLPDPDQITSARDMALLGHALIYHYPRYYAYFSETRFVYAGAVHRNHNHLMERYDGMDGIKTGYIRASGFNLVASAVRGQTRLIGVVFGGRSAVARDNHMAQLLDQAFAAVPASKTFQDGDGLAEGDGDDLTDRAYVPLPAKVAAVFPLAGRIGQPPAPASASASSVAAPPPPPPPAVIPATPAPPELSEGRVPAPAPVATNWGVQIGAFSSKRLGERSLASIARNMPELIGQADRILQKVSAKGVPLYRARFMGMDEKTARILCAAMVKRGKTCHIVTPE